MRTIVCLTVILLTLICVSTAEKKYVIKRITDEGSNYFDMNNSGEVAFVGIDDKGKQQVYLYSGGIVRQLTLTPSYSYSYTSIDINDKGHIVWSMYSAENTSKLKYVIMFYNGAVTKLIDNLYYDNYDPNVKINNSNQVVWQQYPYYGGKTQCYRFDGKIHNLGGGVNNPNAYPVINDNGLIAWYGDNRWENDWNNRIRFTNPGDTIMKTIPQGNNEGSSSPCIDNLNNIFFIRYDNGYYDLYRFNNGQTTKIADSIYQSHYAASNGYIVYTKGTQNNYSVHRYSTTGYTILDKGGDFYYPNVNNTGICVWKNGINEIFTNRDGIAKKIGADCHKPPLINNEGTICFAGYDWDNYGSAIYVAEYRDVLDFSGRIVLNQQGGKGVADVEILSNGKVIAKTDVNGIFICPNIDVGAYTFTFQKQGYTFNPSKMMLNLNANYSLPQDIIATPSTGVENFSAFERFVVYLNGFNTELKIKSFSNYIPIQTISIIDILGRTIYKQEKFKYDSPSETTINVSNLLTGIYIVRIKTFNQVVEKSIQIVH